MTESQKGKNDLFCAKNNYHNNVIVDNLEGLIHTSPSDGKTQNYAENYLYKICARC